MESPFEECVDALGAIQLTLQDEKAVSKLYNQIYPITRSGKVDWNRIENKISIENDNPTDIIPALEKLIKGPLDKNVYIDWDGGPKPMIKTDLDKVIAQFFYVRRASFDQFLFNPTVGYIIEVRSWGDITVGVVPVPPHKAA